MLTLGEAPEDGRDGLGVSDGTFLDTISMDKNMIRHTALLLLAAVAVEAKADLVNGDFSDTALGLRDTITQDQANSGWYTRGVSGEGVWSITGGSGGTAIRDNDSPQPNNLGRGIAQIFTAPGLTGKGVFSFDYAATEPVDVSGSVTLSFWLVGYTGSGTMSSAADIDTYLILSNKPSTDGDFIVVSLLDDSRTFQNGNFSGSYTSPEIDFGTGYDYFGVAFSAGVQQAGQSVALDNVELVLVPNQNPVPVPLPAALWLFGSALLGLLGHGYRRRR